MNFLLDSQDVLGELPEQIGGKAFQLARLTQHGCHVPAWCVLSCAALARRSVHGAVLFSAEDLGHIAGWMRRHGPAGTSFIVRSSMVGEDGERQSFAGQLESFPNLRSVDRVAHAINACVASGRAERVQAYLGQSQAMPPVAVILQVMIDAEVSGVLFTADPKDGCRRRFLISATYGAGDAVVSGQFDCDEFTVDPFTGEAKCKLANKTEQLVMGSEGLQRANVEPDRRELPSLTNDQLRQLTTLGKRLTIWQRKPLDLEWVIRDGQLWVVQMRPITSLGHDRSPQSQTVFDNSNIQESFNGLTLPLTFSFACEAYHKVYRQLMEVMGFSQRLVAEHDRRHQQMLALVKGRVYYNINSWYEGLLLLPSFGRNKEDMEKMMGLEKPVDLVRDQTLTWAEKLARVPGMVRILARLAWAFWRIEKHFAEFREGFETACLSFPREDLVWMSPKGIFQLHDRLKTQVLGHWKAPIINDFYTMMMAGRVRRTLKKIGKEDKLPELLAGEDLESTKPTKTLVQIADQIKRNPALLERVLAAGEDDFFSCLESVPEVAAACRNYIELYGDRVAGELKLETETLRQNPAFLARILLTYVDDSSLSLAQLEANQTRMRVEAEAEIFALLSGSRLRRLRSDLKKFRNAVRLREAMRMDRSRSFGIFRSLYLALGQKLQEQGHLKNSRDIFYLTMAEIDDFFHAKACFDGLEEIVEMRRRQYETWRELRPGAQIMASVPLGEFQLELPLLKADGGLVGLGCYPGRVEGEIFFCEDPSQAPDLRGKILLAERTDPGWTPLFLQTAGLIVERGSQLSHSAVVARELGLPTIVAVPGVCQRLKTGDRVVIDGQSGVIELLMPAPLSQPSFEAQI